MKHALVDGKTIRDLEEIWEETIELEDTLWAVINQQFAILRSEIFEACRGNGLSLK